MQGGLSACNAAALIDPCRAKVGGNAPFHAHLKEYGLEGAPMTLIYDSPAVAAYKEKIQCLVDVRAFACCLRTSLTTRQTDAEETVDAAASRQVARRRCQATRCSVVVDIRFQLKAVGRSGE